MFDLSKFDGEDQQIHHHAAAAAPDTPPTTVPPPFKGWTTLLICVTDDPYDMHDLAREPAMRPLLSKMMNELPPAFANGCGQLIE